MITFYPGSTPPPGHFIREELEARDWTQRDLAYILNVPEQAVNLILSGKRGISPEMAKALGKAFDVAPEFFLNLQNACDLARARDPDIGVERRARLQAHYPIREMIKRGWLEDTDAVMLEVQVAKFFEVNSVDEVPHLTYAPKKTHYNVLSATQLAWLFRVRQIANAIAGPKYSERSLRSALPRLRQLLADPEETRHVPRILMDCGVRFVLVEPLPQGKIDGVCFWLSDGSPVIGMSMRVDRIDNFWFVLRHEIEHVLQEDGREEEVIDMELKGPRIGDNSLPMSERTADEAAAEFCIPQDRIEDFIARKSPFFSERDILGFARVIQVHPGIVVGQIQNRTGRWELLRRYLVKIREFVLLGGANFDGWGQVAPVSI
jgi:HTH-type transcriptional regulator / antitoxin HigA